MTGPERIAIVGSGIAGLAAGWLLARRHHVTLYERHAAPGMGAFNLDLETASGARQRVDVPLRVFKSGYYAQLMALYRAAGVAMQPSDHAAAFFRAGETQPRFRYSNLRIGRVSLPLVGLRGAEQRLVLREALRLLRQGRRDLRAGFAADMCLQDYLEARGYAPAFRELLLLPSFAAIATCSLDAVRAYPAEAILDFYTRGALLDGIWRARDGADDVIARLLAPVSALRCGVEVTGVRQADDGAHVLEADGGDSVFDHVVLATQANQAARMTAGSDPEAAALLARIPYAGSEVVVHRDVSAVPGGLTPGSPVSYLLDPEAAAPMASIRLNAIKPGLAHEPPIFQTWNPLREPAPTSVLGRARFERPLVTLDSRDAVSALADVQARSGRRLHYCGSYAAPGIPLLESAVRSAMVVSARLQATAPWAD